MGRDGVAAALLSRGAPVLLLALLSGCARDAPAGEAATTALAVEVVPLVLDQPAAQPSVVADPARQRFVLSWQERDGEGCTRLRTATLSKAGELGEIREAARGCDWFVNWADFPSLAIAGNGDWWTFYLQKSGPSTYAYDIRLLRSEDEGRSWSAPITPHEDRTPTEHGFVSMLPLGGDRMLIVWLDGRHTLASPAGDGHGGHAAPAAGHAQAEGPMSLRSAELGRDFVLRHAQEVDARVCSCCPTDLVRSADGPVLVYRNRSEDEIRDIHAVRYREGRWSAPAPVREDGWRIAACPVNGPAVAARGERVVVAWPTMAAGPLEVKVAALGDEAPATVLEAGHGVLGRPDLVPWGEAGWLAVWLGAADDRATALRLRALDAGLRPVAGLDVATLPPGRGTGMPRLARLDEVAVLVWTEPSETEGPAARLGRIEVRRITPPR